MTTLSIELEAPCAKEGKDEVYPLIFTPENLNKFWEQAKQFPTLYGYEVRNIDEFIELFFDKNPHTRELTPLGLFWVVNPDKFSGVFFLTEIREAHDQLVEASVHYSFFDRRHNGRVPLVRAMFKFWFAKYGFQRINAEIPNYVTPQARHFALECGMKYEGKKRAAAKYKEEWFDVNLYGILRAEALNG